MASRAAAVVLMTLLALLICLALVAAEPAPAQLSVRAAICQVFGSRCAAALTVARCESRLNPFALGQAGERGLFQIHPVHFGWVDERRLWQPRYNSLIAYRLSRGGTSWRAWTCRP